MSDHRDAIAEWAAGGALPGVIDVVSERLLRVALAGFTAPAD